MPDVREKLVELRSVLGKSVCWGYDDITDIEYIDYEETARNLLANGVTIQRWIPVTERLPEIPDGWAENPEPVLYMMASTRTIRAGYYGEGGVYRDKYFREYREGYEGCDADDVLCWMWQKNLPQPPFPDVPKGE